MTGKSEKAGIVGDLTANCAIIGGVAWRLHCRGLFTNPRNITKHVMTRNLMRENDMIADSLRTAGTKAEATLRMTELLEDCKTVKDLAEHIPRYYLREILPKNVTFESALPRNWTKTTKVNTHYGTTALRDRCIGRLMWHWEQSRIKQIMSGAMTQADIAIRQKFRDADLSTPPMMLHKYVEWKFLCRAEEHNLWKEYVDQTGGEG